MIDLEGCHGPEGDILGGYVTSLVLLLLDYWHYYFMSEIGGVSTVGISLPKTGVPTVCSERAVSGILYAESTLSTGYTQYVYTVIRGYLLLRRDPEGVVATSGLLAILGLGKYALTLLK